MPVFGFTNLCQYEEDSRESKQQSTTYIDLNVDTTLYIVYYEYDKDT